MAKFKVGDRVVGNEHANMYGVTRCGWRGKVVGLEPLFLGQAVYGDILVEGEDRFGCIWRYWVDSSYFDLDKSDAESPSHPDDCAKKRDGRPYKRRVVIEISDDGATAEYIVGKNHAKGISIRRHPKDKPNDKYAALYAVSKLFGLDGTVEKFVPKDKLNALEHSIGNAKGYLDDAEQIMKNITAAGK